MKTITGTINSSKPISLSKASSILKGFISKDTGASQAVSVFLKRSSDSLHELVQFHKELKSNTSERKQKRRDFYENGKSQSLENSEGSEKKKKHKKRVDFEEDEGVKSTEGKKKKKKKRRHVEEEEEQ